MRERQAQKILKQDPAIARFIGMFPARAALVPIFKGLFEMKLNRVNQLAAIALDHHLISTKVGSCQQLKTFRDSIELKAVILPDSQNERVFRRILPDCR